MSNRSEILAKVNRNNTGISNHCILETSIEGNTTRDTGNLFQYVKARTASSSFDLIKFSLGERCSGVYFYLPELRWLVASDQFRQLSRRHKAKANLQRADEAQTKAETRVCT